MTDIFQKNDSRRITRYSDGCNINIPTRKHEYGKNCFSYLGLATIWNGIENWIKQSKSCNNFKNKIK